MAGTWKTLSAKVHTRRQVFGISFFYSSEFKFVHSVDLFLLRFDSRFCILSCVKYKVQEDELADTNAVADEAMLHGRKMSTTTHSDTHARIPQWHTR